MRMLGPVASEALPTIIARPLALAVQNDANFLWVDCPTCDLGGWLFRYRKHDKFRCGYCRGLFRIEVAA